MKEYLMQWEPWTGLAWEYRWHANSDEMAISYAERHTLALHNAIGFDGAMLVWREPEGDQKLIARFVVNKPSVTNTHKE